MEKPVVLIYRLGSLGDTVVSLPCFHLIERAFPAERRVVLTNFPISGKAAPLEAVIGGTSMCHGTISYPVRLRSPVKIWKLYRAISSLRVKKLVYMMPSRGLLAVVRDVVFFKLCGISTLYGVPWSANSEASTEANTEGLAEHESLRLARLLQQLGDAFPNSRSSWDLKITQAEFETAHKFVGALKSTKFFAINVGGKDSRKDWGINRWVHLLTKLGELHKGYGLLIVGGEEDAERANRMTSVWPGASVSCCGKLSPRESAAALSWAMLFIGHDSGPMHLAAAVGVKCIGLFGGNGLPGKWYPFGEGHVVLDRSAGMQAISVCDVLSAVRESLARNDTGR